MFEVLGKMFVVKRGPQTIKAFCFFGGILQKYLPKKVYQKRCCKKGKMPLLFEVSLWYTFFCFLARPFWYPFLEGIFFKVPSKKKEKGVAKKTLKKCTTKKSNAFIVWADTNYCKTSEYYVFLLNDCPNKPQICQMSWNDREQLTRHLVRCRAVPN